MKLKTLLFTPLLIAGLAYAGAKGYIYYKTKTAMDKIIQLAAPIVQIDYTDVGSLISGTIYIDNLRITPTGTYDEIKVDQLAVSGDGLSFLFDISRGFKNNGVPPKITIAFDKLEASVSSPIFAKLTSTFKNDGKEIEIENCSIPGILNATGLSELDVSTITASGSFGYGYDKDASEIELELKYELADIESTLVKMELSQLPIQGMITKGKMPIVESIRLTRKYQPGYMKKIVSHCANNSSLATSAFVDDLVTQSDDYYLKTLGFVPGPGLGELFRQLIQNAGTIEISAMPSTEITPALLKAYRPEDLVDLFGVTARYNDNPITDLSFSTKSSTANRIKKPRKNKQVAKQQNPTIAPVKVKEFKPKPKLRYLDTEVSTLKKYLNYKVRAYTLNSSKPKQGILVSVVKNRIDIEHLMLGGKMTSHINTNTINRIEVLRKEQPEDK